MHTSGQITVTLLLHTSIVPMYEHVPGLQLWMIKHIFTTLFQKMPVNGNLKSDISPVTIPMPSGATLTKSTQLNYFSNALNTCIL